MLAWMNGPGERGRGGKLKESSLWYLRSNLKKNFMDVPSQLIKEAHFFAKSSPHNEMEENEEFEASSSWSTDWKKNVLLSIQQMDDTNSQLESWKVIT